MKTITFRTDSEVENALACLTADGRNRSQAVREAIIAAAHRAHIGRLTAEARAVADDPDDMAEGRAIQADMEPLRAW